MQAIKKSTPFHIQIYEILKSRILDGEISSGERLFENKISQELSVSRSPVREALRILEQDELVIQTHEGLIVNPMNFSDVQEVYECRMAVEPFAAKLSANYLTAEHLDNLRKLVKQARKYHSQKKYEKVVESNTEFHDIIVQNCNNSRLIGIIQKNKSLIILSRRAEFQYYHRNDDYLTEHEVVLEALCKKDGDEAERLLRLHISSDFTFYERMYKKMGDM